MREILVILLSRLDAIGEKHDELFDTDVRQNMSNAIMAGFVRRQQGYVIPDKMGMFSEQADADVVNVIAQYVAMANRRADELELKTFHDRLNALQDRSARSNRGNDYDEFLGHSPPEFFDASGIAIRTH